MTRSTGCLDVHRTKQTQHRDSITIDCDATRSQEARSVRQSNDRRCWLSFAATRSQKIRLSLIPPREVEMVASFGYDVDDAVNFTDRTALPRQHVKI
ncbi:unnamed protein product [Parajaminaea phylloscopi]